MIYWNSLADFLAMGKHGAYVWGSFVVMAALSTGFLGWVVARRELAPLHAIKQKAADITAHRLHTRIPSDAVPVELVSLVETLNAMLTRLETSFAQLSDFSSDIAHELRTPVSNLLTQTQVTLSKARSPDEYRDILASNAEDGTVKPQGRVLADAVARADACRRKAVAAVLHGLGECFICIASFMIDDGEILWAASLSEILYEHK